MKRRHFLIGATAAAAALVWWKRPGDRAQPYDAYFSALNRELARNGPMRPVMVIDLDRLDRNIDRVASTLRDARPFRFGFRRIELIEWVSRRVSRG